MPNRDTQSVESFGTRLTAMRSGSDLHLKISPKRPVIKRVLGIFFGIGPFAILGAAYLCGVHQAVLGALQRSNGPQQLVPSLIGWFAGFIFATFLAIAIGHFGKPVKIRFRAGLRGRLARAVVHATGSEPSEVVSIKIKRGGSSQGYFASVNQLFNFRIQQNGVEEIPSGEHVTHSSGGGDWWLRFETANYEPWCINLPIPDASAERLAELVGDTLGVECIVVRRIDATTFRVTGEESQGDIS